MEQSTKDIFSGPINTSPPPRPPFNPFAADFSGSWAWPPKKDISKPTDRYLIDTENIQKAWTAIPPQANPGSQLTLFYSSKTSFVTISQLGAAYALGIELGFIECCTGANAMDFQIVTYLGYLIARYPFDNYILVTNDSGYDAAVRFWAKKGVNIRRIGVDLSNKQIIPDPAHFNTIMHKVSSGAISMAAATAAAAKTAAQSVTKQPDSKPDVIQENAKFNIQAANQLDPAQVDPAQLPETAIASANAAVLVEYETRLNNAGLTDMKDQAAVVNILMTAMAQPKPRRRVDAYNAILGRYGRLKGDALYKKIKDAIADISNNGPYPIKQLQQGDYIAKYRLVLDQAKTGLRPDLVTKTANAIYAVALTKPDDFKKAIRTRLGSYLGAKLAQSVTDKIWPRISELQSQGWIPD